MWLSTPMTQQQQQQYDSPRSARQPPERQQHESMVQAAHQHFRDDDSSSCSISSNNTHIRPRSARTAPPASSSHYDDVQGLVSLSDHMDSFPLVPLPIIPRLGLADLRTCYDGLQQLLVSLTGPSATRDDTQLAKYASRQLSLVERHMEQARARERVQQLLSGQLSAPPASITQRQQQQPSLSPAASTAKSLPIFLTPPALPRSNQSSSSTDSLLSATASTAAASLRTQAPLPPPFPLAGAGAKKQKAAIEAAKALIQANLQRAHSSNRPSNNNNNSNSNAAPAFVIAAGDHSSSNSRMRRRQLQTSKKTPAEVELMRIAQLEREREKRRQNAYKRLLARQALQQAKKLKPTATAATATATATATVRDNATATVATNNSTRSDRDDISDDSDDDDDASDVSNCSDSDEANERAIWALGESAGDDDAMDAGDDDESDDALLLVESVGDDDSDVQTRFMDSENNLRASVDRMDAVRNDKSAQSTSSRFRICSRATDVEVIDDDEDVACIPDSDRSTPAASSHLLPRPAAAAASLFKDVDNETATKAQIADEVAAFVATRRATRMAQLQLQQQQQHALLRSDAARTEATTDAAAPSRFKSQRDTNESCADQNQNQNQHTCIRPTDSQTATRSSTTDSPVDADASDVLSSVATTLRPASAVESVRSARNRCSAPPLEFSAATAASTVALRATTSAEQSPQPRARIRRPLLTHCRDYRSYFETFDCILTSVLEQRHAVQMASTTPTTVLLVHDHALRLQLKLYESWQSIMHDYATVFGKTNFQTPQSIVSDSDSDPNNPFTAHYRINSTTRREVCDIVVTALDVLGDWDEHPSGLGLKTTWNLLWTWSKPRVERKTLLAWQRVNHFAHAKALTRKDCLKKHIGRYAAMGGKMKAAYDIVPQTFILPQEYIAFVQAFQDRGVRLRQRTDTRKTTGTKNIWILKPVALSRGRGISLISNLSDVVYGEQVVIQEYIANPLLLDGYKFDLRLYVLVTSFNPLEAFFYNEGFVRICTRLYEDSDLSNLFVHLTNSSIQKANQDALETSDNPIHAATAAAEAGGTKMTLAYLWKRLAAMGADVPLVQRAIDDVIVKSLLCGEDHIPFQVNSFDLYGYDILLDDTFRPWLIEINASPSMARENDLDYKVKDALILDTIRLVDPLRFDRTAFVDVVRRRLQDAENERRRPHAHIRHPRETEELVARQLNEDLTAILRGRVPRSYGELPERCGGYRRLCPHTTSYNQLVKLKKTCVRTDRRVVA